MGCIPAYYWKHWSVSTIGLTVNTLAINGDVFHEWEEEQQGLRRIIPLHTNAIFSLMLGHRRTCAAFASSQRGFGRVPGRGSPSTSVCWGWRWEKGQEPENGRDLKPKSTRVGQLKRWMSHFSPGKCCAGWQRGNPQRQKTKTEKTWKTDEKRQEDRHKQRETDERDWKRKRPSRGEREMTEEGSRDSPHSQMQYKSPRSNLNVYHLN